MEFKGLGFVANKCSQYKHLRISMVKLYHCTDPGHPNFLCFGPVSVADVPENFNELSLEEQVIKGNTKVCKDVIIKAHKRVVEKGKEIRQNNSKAVVSGRRSESGKRFMGNMKSWSKLGGVPPMFVY